MLQNNDSFQIQFRSERAIEHMFRVKNGRVEPVISTYRKNKGYPQLIGLKVKSKNVRNSSMTHPNGLRLVFTIGEINIFYRFHDKNKQIQIQNFFVRTVRSRFLNLFI